MKNTIKNHFNPKGHLKGFANGSKQLYRYRKDKGIVDKPKHYGTFGWKPNLYPQSMEDMLEKFDNDLPLIVVKLEEFLLEDDKTKSLEIEEIHSLARFIIFQITRISKFKKKLDKDSDIVKRQSKIYQNVPELGSLYDEMYSGDAWFEEMVIDMNNKLVEEVLKHTWIILIAEEGSEYILSDSGLATGTNNLKNNPKGLGLGSQDTLKWFPLSKRLCLIICSDNKGYYSKKNDVNGIQSIPYDKKKVKYINGLIALCSDEFIYASNELYIKEALEEADRIEKKTNEEMRKLRL